MNYARALAVLEERQETRIELGLERVRAHLRSLGYPQERFPSFHVAGTNGKGSVCAILDSALRAAGLRSGLYTSPHLFDVRERIAVSGKWIPKPDFARLFSKALRGDCGDRLTYFELLTSVAFQWFAEKKVAAAVLETGLGGRLDATNVIERPLAAIITSIDFDHMQFLGKTLGRIASEKAGIFKSGCPALCPPLPSSALSVVRRKARQIGAELTVVRPMTPAGTNWRGASQRLYDREGRLLKISLLGYGQSSNAALAQAALAAAPVLRVTPAQFKKGLARVVWPGRFEVRRLGARTAILDGAHNPQAVLNLARTWKSSPWARRPARWIIGAMRDKDVSQMLSSLRAFLRDVVTVRPPSPRAMDAAELAALVRKIAPKARVTIEGNPAAAVKAWRRGPGPATAVICGSFYLVGSAEKALGDAARG